VIEAEAPFALLYLNNNLHALHHADPWRAWYDLPRTYRARKGALLAENGGYFYKGYLEVMRRYLFTPKEPIAHPSA
jgi:fatty acid desaturase